MSLGLVVSEEKSLTRTPTPQSDAIMSAAIKTIFFLQKHMNLCKVRDLRRYTIILPTGPISVFSFLNDN